MFQTSGWKWVLYILVKLWNIFAKCFCNHIYYFFHNNVLEKHRVTLIILGMFTVYYREQMKTLLKIRNCTAVESLVNVDARFPILCNGYSIAPNANWLSFHWQLPWVQNQVACYCCTSNIFQYWLFYCNFFWVSW